LILAHQETAEGDEVAAARVLIEGLGLSGVLFTADALHCQKNYLIIHDTHPGPV
jgi:predicted transposase YbfD/YdcC